MIISDNVWETSEKSVNSRKEFLFPRIRPSKKERKVLAKQIFHSKLESSTRIIRIIFILQQQIIHANVFRFGTRQAVDQK